MKTLYQAATQLRTAPGVIAYLGNSVTVQKDGYRPHLHAGLMKRFKQPHKAINAGFGGVGSVGSVCTMDDLVIRHKPDLCFIECMTGDMAVGLHEDTGPAVEGILRKLNAIDCAACFLHLPRLDADFSPDNPIIALYSTIAEHYNVPSLNFGQELQSDTSALLKDHVHTTPNGAVRIASLILQRLDDFSNPSHSSQSPERIFDRDYLRASVVPATPDMLADPSACTLHQWRFFYPYYEITLGNEIRFFSETSDLIGLLVIIGPHSGLTIIGGARHNLRDRWSHYERMHAYVFERYFPAGRTVPMAPLHEPLDSLVSVPTLKVIGFLIRPN